MRPRIGALQLKRLSGLCVAALTALTGGCQDAGSPSIEQCIRDHVGRTTVSIPQIENVEQFCWRMLTDQAQVQRTHATARIYEDQIFQNHLMLYMVVFITLSGVILAGVQLWTSYKLAELGKGATDDGSDFTFKPGDIAVKSSVVGVAILAISLAFFSIFVTEVYKLTPLSEGIARAAAVTTAAPVAPTAKVALPPPPPNMTEVQR